MLGLIVARDRAIDVAQRRVGIAQCDDGNVDIRGFANSLMVDPRVGDDDQARLLERASGDGVGEGTGNEASSNCLSASVGGELEDGALSIRTSGNDYNVSRVLDGGDDTSSHDEL